MKKRRNAWTGYPETAQKRMSTGSVPQDPLRTMLLKAIAHSKDDRIKIVDLVNTLSSVSDEALFKTIKDARHDGVISLDKESVWLTTLGHRASLALR